MTPNRALLFHFSALTLNAHAIHLDRAYAVGQEHHKDLLVHGPLTLLLMLTALQANPAIRRVRRIDYRNLAPLYVDDSLKMLQYKHGFQSGRKGADGTTDSPLGSWRVQILAPNGGVAVTAKVKTEDSRREGV